MAAKEFQFDSNVELHDSVTASRSGRDEEEAKYKTGQKVELLEDVVNDGTYPHSPIGTLMMAKGSVGYIKSMGEFLQVIRVYEVHFLDTDMEVEILGCREHELKALDDGCDENTTMSPLFKKKLEDREKNKNQS
ncbi:MAG: nitrogen fixation protein NifZ [Campylobacterales bacterium]|nr:nitrogen fixation protein NifZ [Campylobacterales bacterium]